MSTVDAQNLQYFALQSQRLIIFITLSGVVFLMVVTGQIIGNAAV